MTKIREVPNIDRRDESTIEQRRAGVVATVVGLALVPYFWLASAVVGWGQDAPPFDAPAEDFVDYYVDEFTSIPRQATAAIGMWALVLVLIVSVVRMTCPRFGLDAILSVTLAGAGTAVFVAASGLGVWPTIGTTKSDVAQHLDPGVAQAMVASIDGMHAAGSVLLGFAMLLVAWLLARTDLWGHWLLAAVAFLAGISACTTMFQGADAIGPGGILLWGILVAIIVLVGHRREGSAIRDQQVT
jgi:hypothetical protein